MNDTQAINDTNNLEIADSAGLYMPLGMILFAGLAIRGVAKDDKLVESMDRLR